MSQHRRKQAFSCNIFPSSERNESSYVGTEKPSLRCHPSEDANGRYTPANKEEEVGPGTVWLQFIRNKAESRMRAAPDSI